MYLHVSSFYLCLQTRVWTGSLCACFLDRWNETQGTPPSVGTFSQAQLPDDGLFDEDVNAITGKTPPLLPNTLFSAASAVTGAASLAIGKLFE